MKFHTQADDLTINELRTIQLIFRAHVQQIKLTLELTSRPLKGDAYRQLVNQGVDFVKESFPSVNASVVFDDDE